MYSHPGYHVGDAWYYVDNDAEIHMFYLSSPMRNGGQPFIGHAVSSDLINWRRMRPALQCGEPGSWDDLQLCTGSVIKRHGVFWLAYAATDTAHSSVAEPWRFQRVGMAVSEDLIAWQKISENPVSEPSLSYYEQLSTGERNMTHWRDPFLFDDGEHVYQLICARRRDGERKTRGTVAIARSTDMRTWDILPPIEHDRIAEEMEVPQVYRINGRWYLVFCTLGCFLSSGFRQRFQGPIPERTNFSMVGDSPFGPFHIFGTGQIAPHGPQAYFYAAQLVQFQQRWYLLATIHDEKSERISDPVDVQADDTGAHAGGRSPC